MHLAFVVDRTARLMRSYVNGVLADTVDISSLGSIASAAPLDVGAVTDLGCSNSSISDFRIYPSALPPSLVAKLPAGAASANSGLSLWLPFNGDFIDHSAGRNETVVFFAPQFIKRTGSAMAADFSAAYPFDVTRCRLRRLLRPDL
jgi:hypothetical protein